VRWVQNDKGIQRLLLRFRTTPLRREDRARGLYGARRDQNWRRSEEGTGAWIPPMRSWLFRYSRNRRSIQGYCRQFTGDVIKMPLSPGIVGRVLSGSGRPRDGGPEIVPEVLRDIAGGCHSIQLPREKPRAFIQTGISQSTVPTHWCAARNCPSSPVQVCPIRPCSADRKAGQGAR